MVGKNDKVSPLQIHPPFTEGMHDGEGLFLMGSVVEFMDVHLAGGESNRLGSLALVLHEYGTDSKIGSIRGHCERKFRVRDAEYRGFCHTLLEFLEGFSGVGSPKKGDIFVHEVC